MIKIAELFHSIQGEGKLAGVPSVFIRTSGCNLRCTWCDTPYASWDPVGEEQTVEQIVAQTLTYPADHVVITGGEPMIQADLPKLVHQLHAANKHITIETAGTLWLDNLPIDLASISPKLANSTPHTRDAGRFAVAHDQHRINLDVLRHFANAPANVIRERQWKFVIAAPEDLAEVQTLITQIGPIPPADILLMPEGTTDAVLSARSQWLAELCKQHNYRFAPRLHVALYGNTPGT